MQLGNNELTCHSHASLSPSSELLPYMEIFSHAVAIFIVIISPSSLLSTQIEPKSSYSAHRCCVRFAPRVFARFGRRDSEREVLVVTKTLMYLDLNCLILSFRNYTLLDIRSFQLLCTHSHWLSKCPQCPVVPLSNTGCQIWRLFQCPTNPLRVLLGAI